MIRKATAADVDSIAAAYNSLLQHEQQNGSHSNWQPGIYPTRKSAAAAVEKGEMFVLEQGGQILASVVLNKNQAPEYAQMAWQYPAEPEQALVIHTLCIPPELSGRGLASQMINFAKTYAQEQGCLVIRLDTWAHHEPAKNLYQKHGFRIVGYAPAILQGLIPEELVFLEHQLSLS